MITFKNSPYLLALLVICHIAVASIGCSRGRHADIILDRADSIMEIDPDSAMSMINSIDPASLDDRLLARYSMIKTMAQVKTSTPIDNDSAIRSAYGYYSGMELTKDKMRAAFYLGNVLYDNGSNKDAMLIALEAMEMADELNDSLWMARAYDLTADLYKDSYAMDESIRLRRIAAECYSAAGKRLNVLYALSDIAMEYSYLEDQDKSQAIIDSLIAEAKVMFPQDSALMGYLLSLDLQIQIEKRDYQRAYRTLDERRKYATCYPMQLYDIKNAAWTYTGLQKYDSAEIYLSALSQCREPVVKIEYLLAKKSYDRKRGDYDAAFASYDSLYKVLNKEVRHVFKNTVLRTRGDYMEAKSNDAIIKNEAERRHHNNMLMAICMAVLIIGGLTAYIIIRKNMVIRDTINQLSVMTDQIGDVINERDDLIVSLTNVTDELVNVTADYKELLDSDSRAAKEAPAESEASLRESLNALFLEHVKTINTLCVQFLDSNDSTNSKKVIYQ